VCRLMSVLGSEWSSLPELLRAFSEASRCDPYLMSLRNSKVCEGHGDGWGYVLVGVLESGEEVVNYYRSTRPIYEDTSVLGSLGGSARELVYGVLVAHSRRKAEGSVRIGNTHPLHYSWRGFDMWIVHNGVVDADSIARELGVPRGEDTTDTYYLGELIYRSVTGLDLGNVVEKVRYASRYTKTAMNTSILLYTKGKALLVVTSYVNPDRLGDPKVVDYYRLYLLSDPRSSALVSSSILKYYNVRSESVSEVSLQSGLAIEIDLRRRAETARVSFKLGT